MSEDKQLTGDTDLARAESELLEAGNEIRRLKEEKTKAASSAATEELDQLILEQVQALNELKSRYSNVILAEIRHLEEGNEEASTDDNNINDRIARLEQFLPSATAKQRHSERRKRTKQQTTKKEKQFDRTAGTEGIRCQRKIHSLLAHEGTGDTFRYFPRLNNATDGDDRMQPFCEGEVIYLTEKMDGTTMQATNRGVFKRFERRSRKNGRNNNQKSSNSNSDWHSMTEQERYSVERVDLSNRANRYIAQAVQDYLPVFERIPDGVCIYFEAIDRSIGARFAECESFPDTIFVFDSTEEDGKFVPFGTTVELCKSLGLPCVAHSMSELCLSSIIETFSSSPPPRYTAIPSAPLEGYVVRSTNTSSAAKIRVDDIPKICYDENDDQTTSKAT